MKNPNPPCRFCGSAHVIKWSKRKNLCKRKQRYCCKDCRRTFTKDDGFLRMRHLPKTITEAIDICLSGLSLRGAKDHLSRFHATRVSHVSIWRWIHRFVGEVDRFLSDASLALGKTLCIDETVIKVKGKQGWFWAAQDKKTRFLVAGKLSLDRKKRNPRRLLKLVKRRVSPDTVISDMYRGYFGAVKIELGSRHLFSSLYDGWNNTMERFFGYIKSRYRTTRGFGELASANGFLLGLCIHKNFVQSHMSLGKTPAEVAGFKENLGRNRWLGLIRLAISTTPEAWFMFYQPLS